ncbi:MAG: metallophosphoesterase [Candidatus Kapaibacterium sp.]
MKLTRILIAIAFLCFILIGCSSSKVSYSPPEYITLQSTNIETESSNSLILIGDTQRTGWLESYLLFRESNDSVQFELFKKIASLDKKPSFIVHLGDMVFDASSDDDWRYFDRSTTAVRNENIPLVPVLGNHEYFGDSETGSLNITNRFPELKDSSWRSFLFKNIAFILLNSNTDIFDEMSQRQNEWYNNELNRFDSDNEVKHIIVVTHQPPFTNGTGVGFGDDEFAKKNFVELFNKSKKAQLFISGHCHNYEHLLIDGKHFIVSGGGGGPRRSIDLEGEYKDITNGEEKDKSIRDFHFIEVTVLNDTLIFETHRYNKETNEWREGDEFQIKP